MERHAEWLSFLFVVAFVISRLFHNVLQTAVEIFANQNQHKACDKVVDDF